MEWSQIAIAAVGGGVIGESVRQIVRLILGRHRMQLSKDDQVFQQMLVIVESYKKTVEVAARVHAADKKNMEERMSRLEEEKQKCRQEIEGYQRAIHLLETEVALLKKRMGLMDESENRHGG